MNISGFFGVLFLLLMFSQPVDAHNITDTYNASLNIDPGITFNFLNGTFIGPEVVNNSPIITGDNLQYNITGNEISKEGNISKVQFFITIPEYQPPEIKEYIIDIAYNNSYIQKPINITINTVINWSIDEELAELHANPGNTYSIQLNLTNNGNVPIDLIFSGSTDCPIYMYLPSSITLRPNTPRNIMVDFDIPKYQITEDINCSIQMINSENASDNKTAIIALKIVDDIDPIINMTNFTTVMALEPANLLIQALDNTEVSKVNATILWVNHTIWYVNNTKNESFVNESLGAFNFTKTGRDTFELTLQKMTNVGKYYVLYTAFDLSGNNQSGIDTLTVTKLNSLRYQKTVNIGYVKVGTETQTLLFNNTFDLPTEISLSNIKMLDIVAGDPNASISYLIGIKDPKGDKKFFNPGVESITVSGIGDFYLIFTSNVLGTIVGNINMEMIDQHVDIDMMTFTSNIIKFSPPYVHYTNNNFPGIELTCDFVDTGNLETSYEKCVKITTDYRYFLSDENPPRFKSAKEIASENAMWQESLSDKDFEISILNGALMIESFMILMFFLYLYYIKRFKPILWVI